MTKSQTRQTAIDIPHEEFRQMGHDLVDKLADFYDSLGERKVKPDEGVRKIRQALGGGALPEQGRDRKSVV